MKMNMTFHRILRRYPIKWIVLVLVLSTIIILNHCGIFAFLFTKDYFKEFSYPLEGDIPKYVKQLRAGLTPSVAPITVYDFPFILSNESKCKDEFGSPRNIDLLVVVKSSITHRAQRATIRRTWGQEAQLPQLTIRTVFLLGVSSQNRELTQNWIDQENKKYGDIVQSDFIDSYFNNTIKTLQGFRWVVEKCHQAKFIFFSDDDMYVSIRNLLRFINHPFSYPVERKNITNDDNDNNIVINVKQNNTPVIFFGGMVFLVSPVRTKFSKWYISVDEYPFSHYPPFVNAGSFILSHEALVQIFYASMFTKHLRFDDVFLGLAAHKVKIQPIHNEHFYNWKKPYTKIAYKNVIASHDFEPLTLERIWNEQKTLQNA